MKTLCLNISVFIALLFFTQCANSPKDHQKDESVITYNEMELPDSNFSEDTGKAGKTVDIPVTGQPAKKPRFPGGDKLLQEYLKSYLVYPPEAEEDGVMGRVIVSFIVNTDGEIVSPEITRSLSPDTDKEALRLINNMPLWEPAEDANGNPVNAKYMLTIKFSQD